MIAHKIDRSTFLTDIWHLLTDIICSTAYNCCTVYLRILYLQKATTTKGKAAKENLVQLTNKEYKYNDYFLYVAQVFLK